MGQCPTEPKQSGTFGNFICQIAKVGFDRALQTFRFMVGPGHYTKISKYGPSLSKAVGPVDPSY